MRLDVLLANAHDRTPIVGELKVGRDMDPFFALIQALTAAAHLVTVQQYERMRRYLWRGKFPELTKRPRVDLYLLFVDSSTRGRYMPELTQAAEDLAAKLVSRDELRLFVRYIAGLDLALASGEAVHAGVKWAWSRRNRGDDSMLDGAIVTTDDGERMEMAEYLKRKRAESSSGPDRSVV